MRRKKKGFPWSAWKRALGDMPVAEMPVDKQPSVAITIQKGYSYFSAINSSLLTHGSQSACSQRINLHPSHTPGRLQRSELIIDRAAAPRGGQGDLPQWDGVRAECGSIQVELLVAVLQKHCTALWSTSTWKHLSGWSPAPHGKPSRANAESVIRDSFNIDRFLCQWRDNIVYCGVFRLNSLFPHYI